MIVKDHSPVKLFFKIINMKNPYIMSQIPKQFYFRHICKDFETFNE